VLFYPLLDYVYDRESYRRWTGAAVASQHFSGSWSVEEDRGVAGADRVEEL
jgi:hypothetical protein